MIESSDAGVHVAGEAASQEEALHLLDAGGVQVALVDAIIPPQADLEVAALVRERYPDVPVVLWSADVDRELRDSAASLGIATVVDKAAVHEAPAILRAVADGARS